jgi:BlaI family penicillinase repressor
MKARRRISEAEWNVMRALWREPGASAQRVSELLDHEPPWAAATIKTLLNRLVRKGALTFEKAGKSYRYFPACSEKDARAQEAESFLSRVFDGALSPMLAHFVNAHRLKPRELKELEQLIRQKRKQK